MPEPLVPDDMEATKSIAQHFLVESRKAMTRLDWLASAGRGRISYNLSHTVPTNPVMTGRL